jgi:hypothetical protein
MRHLSSFSFKEREPVYRRANISLGQSVIREQSFLFPFLFLLNGRWSESSRVLV